MPLPLGLLGFVASLLAAPASPETLLVFGASSLTESLQEAGTAFEAKTGTKVEFSFGASSDLARQIEAGAPADVFFSADVARMNRLETAGLVPKAERREFLSNLLVVVVPRRSTLAISSARDLVALPGLALADPVAVPAGVYAKKWLTEQGVWEAISPKVVPTLDVRAALAAVASGNVPAGIVYRTDAATSKDVRTAYVVSGGPEILYSVAPLGGSKNAKAGTAFVAFLAGPEGRAIFERRGFLVRGAP